MDTPGVIDYAGHFNPRSREGSDITYLNRACVDEISIHAPAKGATTQTHARGRAISNFNPRSREGSDFQRLKSNRSLSDFNPRSREGSDSKNHQDYSQ